MAYRIDLSEVLMMWMGDLYLIKKITGKPIIKQVREAVERYVEEELSKFDPEVVEAFRQQEKIMTYVEFKAKQLETKRRRIEMRIKWAKEKKDRQYTMEFQKFLEKKQAAEDKK